MAPNSAQRVLHSLGTTLRSCSPASRLVNSQLRAYATATSSSIPRRTSTNSTIKSATTSTKPTSTPSFKPPTSSSSFGTKSTEPPPPTARSESSATPPKLASLTAGFADHPPAPTPSSDTPQIDWTRSYHGLGASAFTPEATEILLAPLDKDDVEVKPDGIIYLPEIKYRRILNKAFGPGSWGLVPRGETLVTAKLVTREYGLVVQGRLVSLARGEQQYFDTDGIPTATEGCKSNALMRCCKDIGIASELWDPRFIRQFLANTVRETWVEHLTTKKKRKISIRKDDVVKYPYKEVPK